MAHVAKWPYAPSHGACGMGRRWPGHANKKHSSSVNYWEEPVPRERESQRERHLEGALRRLPFERC